MLSTSFNALRAAMCIVLFFAWYAMLATGKNSFQSENENLVTVQSTPENFIDGDTISIDIFWGDEINSISDVTSFSFILAFEGFEIDPQSVISIDNSNSWFADDENWNAEIEIEAEEGEIHLQMDRLDQIPRSGHGFLLKLTSIVVIDDLHGKRPNDRIYLKEIKRVEQAVGLAHIMVNPNPVKNYLEISRMEEGEIHEIELLDMNGRLQLSLRSDRAYEQVYVGHLRRGIYAIRINGQKGSFSQLIEKL